MMNLTRFSRLILIGGLTIAVCLVSSEGKDGDLSKDTSDDDSDAVFKSISPLESAIMPVSRTGSWLHCRLTAHRLCG